MGLIKTICDIKEKPFRIFSRRLIKVSLKHNFPTNKNGRKTFSSQFECPYGYNAGLVLCCHPYKIEKERTKPAWMIPVKGNPKNLVTSICPIYQRLSENYCPDPDLSLRDKEIVEIPSDLLNILYSNLSKEDLSRIKRFEDTKSNPKIYKTSIHR